mgnify:FL=1
MKKLEILEFGRGFAAFYVLMHHLRPLRDTPFDILFRFGQEAVILFFLVSGFVIYLSCQASKPSLSKYLAARAMRIYPVFLLSILLSYVVNLIVGDERCATLKELAGNLLMLQDRVGLQPGAFVSPFCENTPLWSLSYEWWFYCAFAAIAFTRPACSWDVKRAVVATISLGGLLSYVFHPSQPAIFAAYFGLWWAGAELAREYILKGRTSMRGQLFSLIILSLGTAIYLVVAAKFFLEGQPIRFGYPMLQVRHFASGIVLLLVAIFALRRERIIPRFANPFLRIAPISYGLYVSHLPILLLLQESGLPRIVAVVIAVPCCLVVAYILELKAHPWIISKIRGKQYKRVAVDVPDS